MQELKQDFSAIWKTNWPWQMRQLSEKHFLLIKKSRNWLSRLFNLKKKGFSLSFLAWNGECEPYDEPQDTWVTVAGIPVNKMTRKTMAQVASVLGSLVNVDWHGVFRNFFEKDI